MTADYSQIEMRIMAHLSGDAALIEAFGSGEDLHTYVASQAFGIPVEQVDPELRRRIKAMCYGLAYGLSAFGLSGQLGISPAEAKDQMAAYFTRFGGVRDYLEAVVEQARADGYTSTILGRRRYLPDLTSDNAQRRADGRADGAERPDPGQRRGHHQDRDARGGRRPARGRAASAGCCCRCTTSSCWRSRRGSGRRWRRWCASRWRRRTR